MSEPLPDTDTDTGSVDRRFVEALLERHSLTPTSDEVDRLVAGYQGSRLMTGLLRAAPGIRYDEPAVTYDPRPTGAPGAAR